jgi:predicted nucleic acid-binding protein
MTPKRYKVFLDTSVVFAAVLSPGGGARKLFQLGEAKFIQLLIGPNVLRECEDVVRRKKPASLVDLARLLENSLVETVSTSAPKLIEAARLIVIYEPDARVLAEAMQAKPDWFITHDKQHLLKEPSATVLPFRIGTPGDLLQAIKEDIGNKIAGFFDANKVSLFAMNENAFE